MLGEGHFVLTKFTLLDRNPSVGVELYEKKEGIEPKPYPLPLSHGLRCHPFRSVPVIQEQVMVDEQ